MYWKKTVMLDNFASTNQFVLGLVFIILPLDATRICMNWKPSSSPPLQNVWQQKIIWFIHMRKGPNKVGYIGLLQLLSDGSKLFWRHYLISLDRTTLKTATYRFCVCQIRGSEWAVLEDYHRWRRRDFHSHHLGTSQCTLLVADSWQC